MAKSRKHTLCVPDSMAKDIEKAYNALVDIDCNFSRLLQCLLGSIGDIAIFILKQKKNFRHYHWHIVIQDKDTNECYGLYKLKSMKRIP